MTENATETPERADLSWLSDVTPTETTMRTSKRGRQPGKNPVMPHVKSAHESGKTLSLPVPASVARQTERMLRRAALRENWSISVQVLDTDPASATSENVIALKDLDSLAVFLKRTHFNINLINASRERGDCIVAATISRRRSNFSGGNTRHGHGSARNHGSVRIVDRAAQ